MDALTYDGLKRILRECAGVAEDVDLDGDIADVAFSDLGYDSLALLECAARIEGEFGIKLSDDTVTEAKSPRMLLTVVNGTIGVASAG
jgi:act minimal PKS acyl carrier protein